jgi:hypothetical protein
MIWQKSDMQKILSSLLVVAAISSTSFAQTKILSFTSNLALRNTNGPSYNPVGVFATVGSNKFLAVGLNYYTNKNTFTTNKFGGVTTVYTNTNAPVPAGIAYIFKFVSSNVVSSSPVLQFTNSTNHSYYFSGSYISTNSIAVNYFTPKAVTNVAYGETNSYSEDYGKETSVLISTTNNGTTWVTNPLLGTTQTNLVAVTGSDVPNPVRSFWVNIVTNNGKVVFDVYNP